MWHETADQIWANDYFFPHWIYKILIITSVFIVFVVYVVYSYHRGECVLEMQWQLFKMHFVQYLHRMPRRHKVKSFFHKLTILSFKMRNLYGQYLGNLTVWWMKYLSLFFSAWWETDARRAVRQEPSIMNREIPVNPVTHPVPPAQVLTTCGVPPGSIVGPLLF